MKCALCLPVCPTYQLTNDEAQSPRGRIALIQGLADRALDAAGTVPHLDPCLACRACEKVCPADVPYGRLIDGGRALQREAGVTPPLVERAAASMLASPTWLRVLSLATRLARRLWPRGLRPKRLARWLAMPGNEPRAKLAPRPSTTSQRGRVALLTGCVTEHFESATVHALAQLVAACGFAVDTVQGCCGALHAHQGDPHTARRLADRLAAQLGNEHEVLLHTASGCAATVRDYADWDAAALGHLASRIEDSAAFLLRHGLAAQLSDLPSVHEDIAVHAPCSQRNVTGGADATLQLLAALPGVRLHALPAVSCCGAAGSKMLREDGAAHVLADRLVSGLPDACTTLLTSNVGCAWHLRATLADRGRDVVVRHPALYLAERVGLAPDRRERYATPI